MCHPAVKLYLGAFISAATSRIPDLELKRSEESWESLAALFIFWRRLQSSGRGDKVDIMDI